LGLGGFFTIPLAASFFSSAARFLSTMSWATSSAASPPRLPLPPDRFCGARKSVYGGGLGTGMDAGGTEVDRRHAGSRKVQE
jgi:hypothetical protein